MNPRAPTHNLFIPHEGRQIQGVLVTWFSVLFTRDVLMALRGDCRYPNNNTRFHSVGFAYGCSLSDCAKHIPDCEVHLNPTTHQVHVTHQGHLLVSVSQDLVLNFIAAMLSLDSMT